MDKSWKMLLSAIVWIWVGMIFTRMKNPEVGLVLGILATIITVCLWFNNPKEKRK